MGLFDAMLIRGERRSIENPNTPLSNPDDWLYDAFGAQKSSSGVRVSANSALRYAPWWRGINVVSRDVAKLPLLVYRRAGAGKERDVRHPSFRLLRHRSNDELLSAFMFKQTLQAHAMSWGNGYAWIRRDGNATPLELIVLAPYDVIPLRENGRLWYAINVEGVWRRESPANVLHIKGLSADGLVGYSVFQKAADSLGEGMAAQQYGSRFFRNAARPSVVIEVPGNMTAEAQGEFRRQWDALHSGVDASHRTAILTNSAKVHPFSMNARESQLEQLRRFSLTEVASWIGVPVHKVGGEGRTSFSSLEQENQAYLDESLDPWLVNWEEECREKLLTEREKRDDTHVIEFMRQALVRADLATRGNYYQMAIRGGWMSRDDVRSRENMNPLPDDEGGKFFAPLELQVIGEDQPPEVDDLPTVLTITQAVVEQTIPPETAKAMLKVAFPLLTDAQINEIIDPLEDFEPPAPEPAPVPFGGTSDTEDDTTDTDDEGEESDDDPEERSDAAELELTHRLLVDAARRACKHLRLHSVKRAKRAANFMDEIDERRTEDEVRVSEILDAVVRLCGATHPSGNDTAAVCRFVLDETKASLLLAADVAHSRDELAEHVEARMTELETALPERVADLLLNKEPERED